MSKASLKRKKRRQRQLMIYAVGGVLLAILLIGLVIGVRKLTPTKERMELSEYFTLVEEDQTAVIINGEYLEPGDGEAVYGKNVNGAVYLELKLAKKQIDDGYVFDETENILRYATDEDLITANLGSNIYTINKSAEDNGVPVIIADNGVYYLSVDFIKNFTDIQYTINAAPSRISIQTAGSDIKVATIKHKTQLRRFGGVKSKILKDAQKGDAVVVLENYGKWSLVLSDDAVLGCVKNSKISKPEETKVKAELPERTYNHISAGTDITLAWHQVTNATANKNVAEVLASTNGIDVISPTWFYFKDNKGGIADIGSIDYVNYCHNNGIQVWGLVSNLEKADVSTTQVLNTTSSRDALVNNLVSAAISYNLDGINVDIEALPAAAKDGYIQFIRELSLKCEKNDIILSVDNYVPSEHTTVYNRAVQADYADYVVIMAYDEHYAGGGEAGSVASINFVKEGVENTLKEVPAEQIIMGMPLYTRVWITSESGVVGKTLSVASTYEYISSNGATYSWSEEDGQNFCQFYKGNNTYSIWIEDEKSLELKLQVIKDNNLAGGAYWKLGFDTPGVWNLSAKYL